MTKMQSFAWINGQYQQDGALSQSQQASSQFSYNTMSNQQTGTANKSNQYMTAETEARPPKFTHHYGANCERQPSNWQTTAVPLQAVSFQQTARGNNYLQHSPSNLQSGNPSLQVTYGLQHNFHQNSAQNSSTQSPPNMTRANIAYPQQEISANWNQSVGVHGKQSIRTQNGNVVSDLHHCWNQNGNLHNLNGESIKPVSPYTTTATSPQHREVAYNCTMGPAAAHHRPTAHNNSHRQNGTQHGFNLPCYNEAISQSFGNNSKPTNSPSGHNLHISNLSQFSQQYSTHNNGAEATSSMNSNSYNRPYETNLSLSKPDDSPSNLAADAQQQILERRQSIELIENYLRMSPTTGSDGRPQVHTSSPYGQKQGVSMVTMTESHQNMQPVTSTVTEIYNSNASQSIPQSSRHSSPITAHSVMSTQHSVDVPPPQSSVPNVVYVSAKGDGIGNVSQAAFCPENNVGYLSSTSSLMQLLVGIKPPINENQSSVANNCERLEMLSVKANDSSIHSSPSRTRAVAVVQPLLHESYQVASQQNSSNTISQLSEGTATDESLGNPDKLFISPKTKQIGHLKVGPYLHPNKMRSNKYAIRHSAASNDVTFMSSSSSAGPQDLSQKQLCTVDAGSKLDIDTQVHQRVATTAQQSVTFKAPVSQNGVKDKSEMPINTKGVLELSSLPTTSWTPVTLTKYIRYSEKAQSELNEFTCDTIPKLLSMFWDGDPNNLKCALKTGMYKKVITDVKKFSQEHVTLQSVILSQVKSCFGTQLKSYHVLKDKEVFSELPYKSSWLNVNEQLDDIDKEFDFPPSLKHHFIKLMSDSQLDQVETDDSITAQTGNEVLNKMFSSKELEQVDPSEEKQDSSVEATITQTASPNKTESADSSDPYPYSFKIQVFLPEDAKNIFEQAQSNLPESMDLDMDSVEGDLPKVIDATLSNSKLENNTFCPIEEACCIERWKETILGSNTASLSKCQCSIKQSHKDITAKTPDKEVMAVQEKDTFRSDRKLHSAPERENQATGGESVNNQVMTFLWPEIVNVFSIDSSQSNIILISDDEHLSSSESGIPNQMPDFENDSEQAQVKLTESDLSNGSDEKETDKLSIYYTEILSDPEVECVPEQLNSTGNMQSCTSVGSDKKTDNLSSSESEVASQMTDLEENCGQAQLTSTKVSESSLETEEQQTQISATGARQKTWSGKLKRPSSPGRFLPVSKKSKKFKSLVVVDSQPILESASKCGKVFVHATDDEPSASNAQTVELVLFGSTTQERCVLLGSRKNHISSPEAVPDAVPRPPKVLTVSLSPFKRQAIKTVLTWDYSVKRLYKKWKISLPPAKIKLRRTLKAQKCTFASSSEWSLEKADSIGPADTQELPVSSDMRILSGKTKPSLNHRWRRSLSEQLKCDEKKTQKLTVMLKQPADHERNNAEIGGEAVTPLQNNDALKFSVLPISFNFGSNGIKETKDPVPEKPDLVEGKDNNHNKTVTARGTWYSNAEKKHTFFPPTPQTYSLFNKFQKKYMEKMQPYVDK